MHANISFKHRTVFLLYRYYWIQRAAANRHINH